MEKLLIQKQKENSVVKETIEDFGIYCKSFPFKLFGESKDISSNNFNDMDGDDEYEPDQIRIKAYELEVEFAYKGDYKSANEPIKTFLNYLTGRDESGVKMKIYNTYTKIGRQDVRFKSVSNDLFVRKTDEGDVITFKVTFKVNNPTDDIILSNE